MPLPETDAPSPAAPSRKPAFIRVLDRAIDLVFPPRCVSCDAFGAFICDRCHADMTHADGPRCDTCWMPVLSSVEGPLGPRSTCRRCYYQRPALLGVRSAVVYEAAARDAVLALKFRGLSAVAPLMARSMAGVLSDWQPPVASIVPVPLSGQRRRLRGYNQSELLAKEVSRLSGIPLNRSALVKCRHTHAQTALSGDARWQNVAEAFRVGKEAPTGGVLLLDDVITTGATLNACARVLLNEGARGVFALTFSRED